jgi:hypothetical protein
MKAHMRVYDHYQDPNDDPLYDFYDGDSELAAREKELEPFALPYLEDDEAADQQLKDHVKKLTKRMKQLIHYSKEKRIDPDEKRRKQVRILTEALCGRYSEADVWSWIAHSESREANPLLKISHVEGLATFQIVPVKALREEVLNFIIEQDDPKHMWGRMITDAKAWLEKMEAEDGKDYGSQRWRKYVSNTREPSAPASWLVRTMKRDLGIDVHGSKNLGTSCAMFIKYERAVAICKAIGVDPRKVGV